MMEALLSNNFMAANTSPKTHAGHTETIDLPYDEWLELFCEVNAIEHDALVSANKLTH